MKYLTNALIAFCLFGYGTLHAQQTIPAGGGNASGTGGEVNYTIGQTFYTTNSGSDGNVAQGIQQPFEIFVVTALEEAPGIDLEFEIYPNPSSDIVKLIINNREWVNFRFELYDINGNLLQNKKIVSQETEIELGRLPASVYYLQIMDNQKELKTFKIIKN